MSDQGPPPSVATITQGHPPPPSRPKAQVTQVTRYSQPTTPQNVQNNYRHPQVHSQRFPSPLADQQYQQDQHYRQQPDRAHARPPPSASASVEGTSWADIQSDDSTPQPYAGHEGEGEGGTGDEMITPHPNGQVTSQEGTNDDQDDDGGWASGYDTLAQVHNVRKAHLQRSATLVSYPQDRHRVTPLAVHHDISSTAVSPPSSKPNRDQVNDSSDSPSRLKYTAASGVNTRFIKESLSAYLATHHSARNDSKDVTTNAETREVPQPTPVHGNSALTPVPRGFSHPPRGVSRGVNQIEVDPSRRWGQSLQPEDYGKFDDAASQSAPPLPPPPQPILPTAAASLTRWDQIPSPPNQIDWDKQAQLQKWASAIPPAAPQVPPTPTPIPDAAPMEGELSRRNSVAEAPKAQVVYYSAEDEEHTPSLPHSHHSGDDKAFADFGNPVVMPKKDPLSKPPTILSVDRADDASELQSPVIPQVTGNTWGRGHGKTGDRDKYVKGKYWWRRAPHPMYSPVFAAQRLLVETDQVRDLLRLHFSKWGSVRATFHYEVNGDQCEKGFVVFDDPESAKRCLADPERHKCLFRSASRVAPTEMSLVIKRSEAVNLGRTIYIRIMGSRADDRARSASPSRNDRHHAEETATIDGARDQMPRQRTVLPPSVCVDAVAFMPRNTTRVLWGARLRPAGIPIDRFWSRTNEQTGRAARLITEIDLKRRISEREFVPKLCDLLAEICNIYPPTTKGQGWLVAVGGPQDAKHLMNELSKVPGFLVRWADEGDEHYPIDGPDPYPESSLDQTSPVTRVQQELQGDFGRHASHQREFENVNDHQEALGDPAKSLSHPKPVALQLSIPPPDHRQITPPPAQQMKTPETGTVPPIALPDNSVNIVDVETSPNHPHLRRAVVHTYRGRVLTEDLTSDEPRYIDERAIFVGRLNKELETQLTLLRRFERYGIVNAVEYNSRSTHNTYTSARVLFQERAAAERAIHYEHGAESFGSLIKVEVRKVLPHDISTKEMYVDDLGRAISPSMVSQYSPKFAPCDIPPINLPPRPLGAFPTQQPAYPSVQLVYGYPIPPMYGYSQPAPQFPHPPPPASIPIPGPQQMPAPQAPFMGGPTATNIPFPVLCASWGIGYLPAGAAPMFPSFVQQPQQPFGNPSPPHTPGHAAGPQQHGFESAPVVPQDIPPPSPPSQPGSLGSKSTRSSLAPVGYKQEGGMMKVVYDAEQLKQYCQENGINPPKNEIQEKGIGDLNDEKVTLLPISTGGHVPTLERPASVATSGHRNSTHGELGHRRSTSERSIPSARPQPASRPVSKVRTVPIPIPFSPTPRETNTLSATCPAVSVLAHSHDHPPYYPQPHPHQVRQPHRQHHQNAGSFTLDGRPPYDERGRHHHIQQGSFDYPQGFGQPVERTRHAMRQPRARQVGPDHGGVQ
nr:uncharacterized protein CI109_004880 [Kwoniella shandongensis]KAA5526677.1 hypothetical protein CI109_004880 [Kwoniella shandongensis]